MHPLFALELGLPLLDPLLEIVPKPSLNEMRKPDGPDVEVAGRRRPGPGPYPSCNLSIFAFDRLQKMLAIEEAQMAIAIKLHVPVDVNNRGEFAP